MGFRLLRSHQTRPLRTLLEEKSLLSNSSTWRDQAACRGLDPEVFYPITEEEEATAKNICADCTVRQSCLEHAITHREKDGIWGGATERERRRIIRQRRRTA